MTDSSPTHDRVMIWVGMYVHNKSYDLVASPERDETMELAEALFENDTDALEWENPRGGPATDRHGAFHLWDCKTGEHAAVKAVPLMNPGALFKRGVGPSIPLGEPAIRVCTGCGAPAVVEQIQLVRDSPWECFACGHDDYKIDSIDRYEEYEQKYVEKYVDAEDSPDNGRDSE